MHYKNKRPASVGDPVVIKDYRCDAQGPSVTVGLLVDVVPGAETCNGIVAIAGRSKEANVNLGEVYHAQDAFEAAFFFERLQLPRLI